MKSVLMYLSITVFMAVHTAIAQVPDNTFGVNGRVTAPESGTAKAIARQADGKLVTAGAAYTPADYHFQLFRFNTDGSLDNEFGTNGVVHTEISFTSEARAIIIQPDGKILVGGLYHTGDFANIYHLVIARYKANGTLDSTFGTNGLVMPEPGFSDELTDMVLQADGKIVAGGALVHDMTTYTASFMLLRFNSNGSLDNSFGTGGIVTTAVNVTSRIARLLLQPDGKIIAAGTEGLYDPATPDYMNFALVRYNQQGSIDNTFGVLGMVITNVVPDQPDILQSALLQPDGKIIAGGTYGNDHYLVRYLSNGNLDNSFGTNGFAVHNKAPGTIQLTLQDNGKIVAACRVSQNDGAADFLLNGYLANGDVDVSFGTGGTITTDFISPVPEELHDDYSECMLIQPDGKIVAAGSSNGKTALVRYSSSGGTSVQDVSHQTLDLVIYPNPFNNRLNMSWQGDGTSVKAEVSIWNALGQRLIMQSVDLKKGNNILDISNLTPGNYILCVTDTHGKSIIKTITKA